MTPEQEQQLMFLLQQLQSQPNMQAAMQSSTPMAGGMQQPQAGGMMSMGTRPNTEYPPFSPNGGPRG
jgi:hypothetical protein